MSTAAISVRINGPERYLFRGTGQSTTQASLSEHNHAASEQTGKPDPENESGGRESKEHKGTHSARRLRGKASGKPSRLRFARPLSVGASVASVAR